MLKRENNKVYNFLIFSAFFLYVLLVGAKNLFSAEIAMIMHVFNIDKPTASMTTTYYFCTYGAMQVVLFFIISKVNLKKFLVSTLSISAILMALVGFCTGITQIYVVYAISGVTQAGLWAGLISTISMYLPKDKLAFANKLLSIGISFASGVSYGTAAIFNAIGNWNLPFIILGSLVFVAVWVFYIAIRNADKIKQLDVNERLDSQEIAKKEVEYKLFDLSNRKNTTIFYGSMFVLSFLSASLYFGILNWVPSLMVDTFGIKISIATLITTIVPISLFIGPVVFINFCEKYDNILAVGMVFFGLSLVLVLYLIFFYQVNLIVTLIVVAVSLNVIGGARSLFTSVVPIRMRNQLNSGSFAAIANAFSSFGAGIGPTIVGAIIEFAGWRISYTALLIGDAILVALLFLLSTLSAKCLKKQKS